MLREFMQAIYANALIVIWDLFFATKNEKTIQI